MKMCNVDIAWFNKMKFCTQVYIQKRDGLTA